MIWRCKCPPPPAVRIAIRVLLNHVDPRFENCKAVVTLWIEGKLDDTDTEDGR